jgi:hypothetical protein
MPFCCASFAVSHVPADLFLDGVEIRAIELALSVKEWKDKLDPRPSDAFQTVIRMGPTKLVVRDQGTKWSMEEKDEEKEIDTQKYPLIPNDVTTARNILAIPYIKEYLRCMKKAYRGQATDDCFKKLINDAESSGISRDAIRTVSAHLGAQLQALAPQNPEWKQMVIGDTTPREVQMAMAAYNAVELDKLQEAVAYIANSTTSAKDKVQPIPPLANQPAFARYNAALASAEASDPSIVGWNNLGTGHPEVVTNQEKVYDSGHAPIYTFVLNPDSHVLLKGKLDAKMAEQLKASKSMEDLLGTAKQYNVGVFLSRPGSEKMYYVNPDNN